MNKLTRVQEIYDLTPDEKEIINNRIERRLVLRKKYLQKMYNPNTMEIGHIIDEQLYQFNKRNAYRLFQPSIKKFFGIITLFSACITLIGTSITKFREEREHRFRTGQVSYRDRDTRFY